jgi:hypothetical protein
MDEGWSEFIKSHDLKTRYFMVFKKLDARSLKVTVFNYKSCEQAQVCRLSPFTGGTI